MPVWSPDGRLLATIAPGSVLTGERAVVKVWEVAFPTSTHPLHVRIDSLSFSLDGKRLAVDGRIWEVAEDHDRPLLSPSLHKTESNWAAFDAAGRLWAANSLQAPFKLRQLIPREQPISLTDPSDRVYRLGISPDGKTLVAAAGNALRPKKFWNPNEWNIRIGTWRRGNNGRPGTRKPANPFQRSPSVPTASKRLSAPLMGIF